MAKSIYILSGGTFVDVSPHFSLAARAFGQVGATLTREFTNLADPKIYTVVPIFTAMAGQQWAKFDSSIYDEVLVIFEKAGLRGGIVTNDDLLKLVSYLKTLADTKIIVMATAVCDWVPTDLTQLSQATPLTKPEDFGRRAKRLKTRLPDGTRNEICLELAPSAKIIGTIRSPGPTCREDILVIGFKTTAGATEAEQVAAAVGMMRENNLSFVLANDINTQTNLAITPEGEVYPKKSDSPVHRNSVLRLMSQMALSGCSPKPLSAL